MAKGWLRTKIPDLREALTGRFREHHGFLLNQMLDHVEAQEAEIASLDQRIEAALAPFVAQVELLTTIPGVDRRSAQLILAEIGPDMSVFPTSGHLASWAGMCPGQRDSAGKQRGEQGVAALLAQAQPAAATQKIAKRADLSAPPWLVRQPDLRTITAQLRGLPPKLVSAGQMTYDLRRLRTHQLIQRIPHTHRYQVTDHGLHTAIFLTRVHDRLIPTGLAQLAEPVHTSPAAYRRHRIPELDRQPHRCNRPRRMTATYAPRDET